MMDVTHLLYSVYDYCSVCVCVCVCVCVTVVRRAVYGNWGLHIEAVCYILELCSNADIKERALASSI